MRRAQRLRHRRDFAAVYRSGRSFRNELLQLRARANGQPESRFGFAVGGALGNAVVRNRIKRRLREAVRSLPIRRGWDIVLTARRGAPQASYHQLRDALEQLVRRAGLAKDSEGPQQ